MSCLHSFAHSAVYNWSQSHVEMFCCWASFWLRKLVENASQNNTTQQRFALQCVDSICPDVVLIWEDTWSIFATVGCKDGDGYVPLYIQVHFNTIFAQVSRRAQCMKRCHALHPSLVVVLMLSVGIHIYGQHLNINYMDVFYGYMMWYAFCVLCVYICVCLRIVRYMTSVTCASTHQSASPN